MAAPARTFAPVQPTRNASSVILSRRRPGGAEDGEGPPAETGKTPSRLASFAALRRSPTQFQLLFNRPHLVPDPPPAEPGQREDVKRLRASLEARIAAKVMNASELIRSLDRHRRDDLLATTLTPFDELLGGGLPRGKAIELAGRRSAGRFSIVLSALAAATTAGEAAVLVDLGDNFDPQIAEANGVDLKRLLWIRPQTLRQAVMAVEMMTATGFQLVVLDAGSHPIRGKRVPDASWVRLARSAETHGAAMLISTPYPLTGTATEAVVAAHTMKAKWLGRGSSPRILAGTQVDVTLEKHRHLRPGRSATLMFQCVEANDWRAGVAPDRHYADTGRAGVPPANDRGVPPGRDLHAEREEYRGARTRPRFAGETPALPVAMP